MKVSGLTSRSEVLRREACRFENRLIREKYAVEIVRGSAGLVKERGRNIMTLCKLRAQ
jgi:hypothetical protein